MSGICRHLSSGILLQILPKALIQRKVPLTILSGISHMRDIHINVLLNFQLCITHIFSFSWIFPEFPISCSIVQDVHQVELTASATLMAINIPRKDLSYIITSYHLSVACKNIYILMWQWSIWIGSSMQTGGDFHFVET